MNNLVKALSRTTHNRYRTILVNLYSDEKTDNLISNTSGENVAGRRKAIEYFLDNPESFVEITTIDGVEDRAKKVLEAIKDIKTGQQVGGSKGSLFPNILEKFKLGDIQSLPNWANSAETPETKRNRVKQVRDNKTKLFDAIENFDDAKKEQAFEMLENTFKIKKPAKDKYVITARPNSQKMIEYLRKIVTSSNIPKRNKIEILPKKVDGKVSQMFGDNYNELFPTLIYIIENRDLPIDSSGNLESKGFQKKKTKLSIATKQALKGLRGSESPSGLKSIMDKIISTTRADTKNKRVNQDNRFLKEIAKDTDLKRQFEEYVKRLSAGVSLNKIPAQDYLALSSEEDNETHAEYGFDDAQGFEDWVTAYDERTEAFSNMQERGGYYVLSSVNDLTHLSDLFTEEDIDLKETFMQISRKELGNFSKRFREFKDLIPMLHDIGQELDLIESKKGFGLYFTKYKKADKYEDAEGKEENYELMLKELINEGMYRKIREGLRKMIYDSMLKLVEDNYRINEQGVTEPIKILENLKIATKKTTDGETSE
jgi:hypothetical protein